ncbi:hypothetical protein N7490_008296 [Penicillium lividum]|nr:hypothetical protein N7490_008296 [Penicillium lividum]
MFAARIIQGFSASAYESLVFSMIGDLFFVHERGIYTAMITFILVAVSNFSSVVCGPVTTHLGWPYLFHLLILAGGLQLLLQFLFVPETQYRLAEPAQYVQHVELDESKPGHLKHIENTTRTEGSVIPEKKTFIQMLAVLSGIYSDENLLVLLFSPLTACLNLAVVWSVLVSGYILSIFVATSFLLSQFFSIPPYNLDAAQVGYLSLGPVIAGLLGSGVMGLVNDPLVRWCSYRNRGWFEPEYRLLLGVVGVLVLPGFIGFGYAVDSGQSYYLTAFLHGTGLFGIIFVVATTANYSLDAFRPMSNEIFLLSMAVKNLIMYAYSLFINDWAARAGAAEVMWTLCLVAGILLLTYPMVFLWGRKYRYFWAHSSFAQRFGVK